MRVTIKTFKVNIKLPVDNNLRLFSETKALKTQIKQNGLIFLKLIDKTHSIRISILLQMLI